MIPERRVASVAAFAKALGAPLRTETGVSLAVSIDDPDASRGLMEAVVHTAAGVFGAAAASICLVDETTERARVPVGLGRRRARDRRRAAPAGRRASPAWSSSPASPRRSPTAAPTRASPPGSPRAPATCRTRCWSSRSQRAGRPIGALTILDRRDGRAYRNDDLEPAALFADLAVKALDVTPNSFTSLGMTSLG